MKPSPGRVVMYTDSDGTQCVALVVALEFEPGNNVPRALLAVFSPLVQVPIVVKRQYLDGLTGKVSEREEPSWRLARTVDPDAFESLPPPADVENGPAMMTYVRGVFEGIGPRTWAWPERVS